MATVNITKDNLDSTVKIFDTFYNTEIVINSNDFDKVRSFFILNSDDFATVDELLEKFKGLADPIAMDETIAYYLNGLRSKSTLLGVSVLQQPNLYAARNVSK